MTVAQKPTRRAQFNEAYVADLRIKADKTTGSKGQAVLIELRIDQTSGAIHVQQRNASDEAEYWGKARTLCTTFDPQHALTMGREAAERIEAKGYENTSKVTTDYPRPAKGTRDRHNQYFHQEDKRNRAERTLMQNLAAVWRATLDDSIYDMRTARKATRLARIDNAKTALIQRTIMPDALISPPSLLNYALSDPSPFED